MTRTNAIIRSIAKRNGRLATSLYAPGVSWQPHGCNKLMLADPTGSLVAIDDKLMSATFVISTTTQDRDGDIMVSKGCVLDNYKRNPVVFYNHQQNPIPIGKAMSPGGNSAVSIQPDRIVATCYFDQQDPDAAYIYGKVKRGFLSATSIGFIPLEGEQIAQKTKAGSVFQREGWLFKRWELLEFSIVGVPANPEALMLDDLDTAQISVKLRKALQPFAAPTGKAHLLPVTEEMKHDGELIKGAEEEKPVADEKQYDDKPDDTDGDAEEQQMPLGAQCLMELAAHIQAKLPQLEPGIAVRKLYEKILPMLAAAAAKDYPDLDLGIEAPEEEEEKPKDEKGVSSDPRPKPEPPKPLIITREGEVYKVPDPSMKMDWSPVAKEMAALRRELRIATGRVD